jgi:hypothetical protein
LALRRRSSSSCFRRSCVHVAHGQNSKAANFTERERERERERDRATERQSDRQSDRQTDRQRDRQTDRQRDRETDRGIDTHTHTHTHTHTKHTHLLQANSLLFLQTQSLFFFSSLPLLLLEPLVLDIGVLLQVPVQRPGEREKSERKEAREG